MTDEIAPRVVEFSADLLEVGVDALTDNEVLKEIPVLGSAVKIAGIGKTIKDRIFLAKIRRFLAAAEPTEEGRRFAAQLQSGERDAERTAEVLLLAIDQINDLEKAPILAKMFAAFLRGETNSAGFRRMTAAVNAAVVDDLVFLRIADYYHWYDPTEFNYRGKYRMGSGCGISYRVQASTRSPLARVSSSTTPAPACSKSVAVRPRACKSKLVSRSAYLTAGPFTL